MLSKQRVWVFECLKRCNNYIKKRIQMSATMIDYNKSMTEEKKRM